MTEQVLRDGIFMANASIEDFDDETLDNDTGHDMERAFEEDEDEEADEIINDKLGK